MKEEKRQRNRLKRGLKSRHMSTIAIGGTIGAGLFLTSGNAISQAGPGGAILAYAIMGAVVFTMTIALVELAAKLPISGAFKEYPNRFFDRAWGYASGWVYWFGNAVTVPAEAIGCSIIVKFWFPDTSSTAWAVFFMAVMLIVNLFSVNYFGECEFWTSGIKVVTVFMFILVGGLMAVGVISGNPTGFDNWTLDMGDLGKAPVIGGFSGVASAFLVAAFSFSNTELIGVSAAESENPARDVPKALYNVFLLVFIFYIGALLVIGTLVPFTDPNLLNSSYSNVVASPFTIVFERVGLKAAASVVNVVMLSALLTAGNSTLYCSSRMLYAMGEDGEAPAYFKEVNKKQVPVHAILATAFVGVLVFFTSKIGDGKLYTICYSICGISTFFNWFTIALCHYRFRKAYLLMGHSVKELPYKAPMYPYASLFGMIMCVICLFGTNYWVFEAENFSWFDFIANYGLIPLFLTLYFVYKWKHKTRILKLEECDLSMEE